MQKLKAALAPVDPPKNGQPWAEILRIRISGMLGQLFANIVDEGWLGRGQGVVDEIGTSLSALQLPAITQLADNA